jgi:glycosyltransferase involved in cell wall biosynthesis
MMPASEPRVAFVQDALPYIGGAERTLAAVLELYPHASIYTAIYNKDAFRGHPISFHPVQVSFIDRLPGKKDHYKAYSALFPRAIEGFDLRDYDLILSFSYAFGHGVRTGPGQLHISYIHTPLRYARNGQQAFLPGQPWWLKTLPARFLLRYLHNWAGKASARVGHFTACSRVVAERVWRSYHRQAEVIYPPVEVDRFMPAGRRDAYYVTVCRQVAHKRVDLIISAFSRLRLPLIVVGDGPEKARLARLAGPNVHLAGRLPDGQVARLLNSARAFVHAAEDDFGISPVEAQAAGCPVIAYGKGGVLETAVEGETGIFFSEQTSECLAEAVLEFEVRRKEFDPTRIRQNALRFSKERFQEEFRTMVARQADRSGWKEEEQQQARPILEGPDPRS